MQQDPSKPFLKANSGRHSVPPLRDIWDMSHATNKIPKGRAYKFPF
jgi:hypothetical protein